MSGFGGAIKLTGESEYKKALKQITQSLKEVSSEMKVVTNQFGRNDTSVKALTAKQEALNNKLKEQTNKLNLIQTEYKRLGGQYEENTKRHNALVASYDKEKAELDRIGKELGESSKEYQEQKSKVDALAKEVAKSTTAQEANEKSMSDMRIEMNKAQADVNKTTLELNKLGTQLNESQEAESKAATETEKLGKTISEQETKLAGLKTAYKDAVLQYGQNSTEAKALATEIEKLSGDLATNKDKMSEADSAADALDKTIRGMDDTTKEAGDGFTVFKGILANLASQAIMSAVNGLKDLAGAMVNIGKDAINSFGDFEQLEGGVKKLFGDDTAKVVIANANKAFSTAGMSANEYMETVTSFSASLISGLNGDTAKAAEISDKAIADMSDNANTFGTDITSIQNAYQGFAKGNFTMLDNLKLGYGGTKEEMLRLVKDAGVVEDSVKSIDDVSFDKIIEAIHITQERMSITGTTAREASATIQGSTASMKSAWQNMLTGMADENANFEQLATNFVGTLITEDGKGGVLGTIVPRISTVISGMSNALQTMLPMLTKKVVPIIQKNIPVITQAVSQALTTILSVLPNIMPVISTLITDIVQTLLGMMPKLIYTGIQILVSLIEGISNAIPQLVSMLPDVITAIVTTLINNIKLIVSAGITLLVGIITGLTQALPQLVDYIPFIVDTIVQTLIENLPVLIDGALQLFMGIVTGLIMMLPTLVKTLPKVVTTVVKGLTEPLLKKFKGLWSNIKTVFSPVVSWFGNVFGKAWEEIKKAFSGVGKFFGGVWKTIKEKFTDLGQKVGDAIGGAFKKAINAALGAIENILNAPIRAINGLIDVVNDFGFNLGYLDEFDLPRLAQGGVLKRGQVGLLEGDGAEAVVPLEKNTQWIQRVADEMRMSLTDGMGNSGSIGGDEITINVYASQGMDVNSLALAVEQRLARVQKQRQEVWA